MSARIKRLIVLKLTAASFVLGLLGATACLGKPMNPSGCGSSTNDAQNQPPPPITCDPATTIDTGGRCEPKPK